MDKEDKILITAYLDGDTSELEGKQVEDLLANDSEALEYANSLKRANIEINNYFKGDEMSRLNKSVDQFISSQIKKESSSSFQNGFLSKLGLTGIADLLNPTKAIGALAASIVLGVLVIPMVFQNEFDDPNIQTYIISVERSDSNQADIIELLEKNLLDMLSKELITSKTIIKIDGDDDIEIFLKLLEPLENCRVGFALMDEVKRKFLMCPESNDKKLSFD